MPDMKRMDSSASNNDTQSPASSHTSNTKKRPKQPELDEQGNPKPVKRRAAKACANCRSRKVRCDVTHRYHVDDQGHSTCSNCAIDKVPCIIEESKRRKKTLDPGPPLASAIAQSPQIHVQNSWESGIVDPSNISNPDARRWSGATQMPQDSIDSSHVPHGLYRSAEDQILKGTNPRRQSFLVASDPTNALLESASLGGDRTRTRLKSSPPPQSAVVLKHQLPGYLKPLPMRMTSVDIDYLYAKGALVVPTTETRNALIRSYLDYVHPFMPLLEVHELLRIIDDGTGQFGKISLLLFQAIMFAGTAFVDMKYLKRAGYSTRKAARKAFFQKARVLYDFDYEMDRVSLVQALLLLTYWYETPDEQKDTWHWMGVAISLAHTIGLHRNPENSDMEPSRKKLWKRIWWSCFMRDRLVALGMRRPTRVKEEDYDVPMLTEDDFEIQALDPNNSIIAADGGMIRNEDDQRKLAQMCIAKAKLCLCISHVLAAQYSVLVRNQGDQGQEGTTRSSVMLVPKKLDQTGEVKHCDEELSTWFAELPPSCQYHGDTPSFADKNAHVLFVQKSILHMVYFTTLSALHRPQVLPAAPATHPEASRSLQDLSRKKVREASSEITSISSKLTELQLERFLPTTGVTVLIPAIIIHLLDIKSCNDKERRIAMDGFCRCMAVLEKLRDNYASADYATQFLEAAIRKADIGGVMGNTGMRPMPQAQQEVHMMQPTPPLQKEPVNSHNMQTTLDESAIHDSPVYLTPHSLDLLQSVPQHADQHLEPTTDMSEFLNFDVQEWDVPFEEGIHGESGGFPGDMNWVAHQWGSRMGSRLNSPSPEHDWVNLDAGHLGADHFEAEQTAVA